MLSILREYLDTAKILYEGEDDITDLVLFTVEDTLDRLEHDPMSLFGRLDWVTKLFIFRAHVLAEDGKVDETFLHHFDSAYHLLGPEGAHAELRKMGNVELLFSSGMDVQAKETTPDDTRAYLRGNLIAFCRENKERHATIMDTCSWKKCKMLYRRGGKEHHREFEIPDAALTYESDLRQFMSRFS